jgi:hypothetical protein
VTSWVGSPSEARAAQLIEAAVVLSVTRIVLAASPGRFTAGWVRRAGQGSSAPGLEAKAASVASNIARAASLLPSTCLSRALTGWVMLRRRGVPSVVKLGARRVDDHVRMHAWLEVSGTPVIGHEEAHEFVTLGRSP